MWDLMSSVGVGFFFSGKKGQQVKRFI